MKKKIASLVFLSVYFFGGMTMAFAGDNEPSSAGEVAAQTNTTPPSDGIDNTLKTLQEAGVWQWGNDGRTYEAPAEREPAISDPDSNESQAESNRLKRQAEAAAAASSPAPSGGSNDMTTTGFKFDVSDLSPSEKRYKDGTKLNLKNILANIGKYLLIATTTIAVLSLVIGGLMISTTGPSDRAAKGKTIIVLNITAIVIALLSYSIIRLVSWLIA